MDANRKPLILNLAPTGMVPDRSLSPHVPLQPKEIVRDVVAAADMGITLVHLHARDLADEPTHRKDVYARIIEGIRRECPDLVIGVSCSGRKSKLLDERAEVLELSGAFKPDLASLTLSSLNFPQQASLNAPATIKGLAERMRQRGIVPELEIFDLGMVNVLRYLVQRDLVRPPLYANVLFGNLATAQADLLEMGAVINRLPPETTWSMAGIGSAQLPVAAVAAAIAPGVRIGLEDNLWIDPARLHLATNLQLVEHVHQLAKLVGRRIMSPAEFRGTLEIGVAGNHDPNRRAA